MAAVNDPIAEASEGLPGLLSITAGTNLTDVYTKAQEASLSINATYLSLLAVAVTSVWFLTQWVRHLQGHKLPVPPGRIGIPLVGDTINFVKAFRNDTLWGMWEKKAAKYGPVFKASVLGDTVVVMDPPAGNKFLFTNDNALLKNSWPDSFQKLIGADGLIMKSGEAYRVSRRHLVRRFLGPEAIVNYVPKMEQSVLVHIEKYWNPEGDSGERDVCANDVARKYAFEFACDIFASLNEPAEIEAFSHQFEVWSNGMLALPVNLPGFAYYKALKARADMNDLLLSLIAKKKAQLKDGTCKPDQDLLCLLLTEKDEIGHLYTDQEVASNVIVLLAAAHDTTASVLTFTIDAAARYPHVYEQLIKEHAGIVAEMGERKGLRLGDLRKMKYTWSVIQEVMRMWPPIIVSFRESSEDMVYKGYSIPKGWKVMWAATRAHKNPAFFENPDVFDPSRFEKRNPEPYIYLPFGVGPRSCPGNELAKIEMLLFMHHILKNFRWSLADPNEKQVIRLPMPKTPKGTPIRVNRFKGF